MKVSVENENYSDDEEQPSRLLATIVGVRKKGTEIYLTIDDDESNEEFMLNPEDAHTARQEYLSLQEEEDEEDEDEEDCSAAPKKKPAAK